MRKRKFVHMIKIAAMHIMTKPLDMYHLGCGLYQGCSNDDPRLTLTYLTSRSNLVLNAFNLDFLKSCYFEYS